jgi:hypothetical protein
MIHPIRNRRDGRKFLQLLDLLVVAVAESDEVAVMVLMGDLNVVSTRSMGMQCRFSVDEEGINIEFQPVGIWNDDSELEESP